MALAMAMVDIGGRASALDMSLPIGIPEMSDVVEYIRNDVIPGKIQK